MLPGDTNRDLGRMKVSSYSVFSIQFLFPFLQYFLPSIPLHSHPNALLCNLSMSLSRVEDGFRWVQVVAAGSGQVSERRGTVIGCRAGWYPLRAETINSKHDAFAGCLLACLVRRGCPGAPQGVLGLPVASRT